MDFRAGREQVALVVEGVLERPTPAPLRPPQVAPPVEQLQAWVLQPEPVPRLPKVVDVFRVRRPEAPRPRPLRPPQVRQLQLPVHLPVERPCLDEPLDPFRAL